MGEFILNGRNYGGSIITPNPSDTPTDTLDSVKIGDTTYEIQGGGGGGSSLIIDAQRYSLEEQVVGIWTDGKPLYQRTWEFSSSVSLSANTWFTSSIPNTNMERIVNAEAMSETGTRWAISGARDVGSYVNLICFRNSAITVKYVTLQYTKTTDTAGSGGYQAYGFTPLIYSEEEREVGVWKNNKPLYQKTIDIGTLPNNNQKLVNHNISDFGEAVRVFGYARNTSNNAIVPLPHNHPNAANQSISLIVTTTQISVQTGVDRSGYVGCVTVQYTKASDVAGSGEYNTLAIPNVHYSTDEQVIGTWIDGKTLYQKTKIFPNTIAFSNDTVLDMEISNVDTIFVEEGYYYDFYVNAIGKLPYSQDGNLQYTISVKVDISNKSHLKISSNTTFGVNSDRYIVVTVRYTKTT